MHLARLLTHLFGIGLMGTALCAHAKTPYGADPVNPVVTNCNVTPPDTAITPPLLTSGLPCSVVTVPPFTLDGLQHGFDYFSWLTFLALNSPADGKTPIGKGPQPGGDAPAIWEQWKEISDVMLPGGSKPAPWNAPHVIPKACQGLSGDTRVKVVQMVGKTPDLLQETNQPFDTGPLIDQHGKYVRYEILVNRPMFEYIVQNRLYSKAGQAAFTGTVAFPEGAVKKGKIGTMGAIMVKASWMVLGPGDDPTHFHTARALIYTPAVPSSNITESCVPGTLGLVGLHVAHKTADEPQWTWSTYENNANVPDQADVAAHRFSAHYNFYNPDCDAGKCPVNVPPPRPWNPNVQPFPDAFTSQITRVVPIDDEVKALNSAFQGLLPQTVWQNYQLISTQWPTDAKSKTAPNGVPAPVYLANTTLETYVQGRVPLASSSCMACHGNAAATTGRTSDFTYILERAK